MKDFDINFNEDGDVIIQLNIVNHAKLIMKCIFCNKLPTCQLFQTKITVLDPLEFGCIKWEKKEKREICNRCNNEVSECECAGDGDPQGDCRLED